MGKQGNVSTSASLWFVKVQGQFLVHLMQQREGLLERNIGDEEEYMHGRAVRCCDSVHPDFYQIQSE